MTPPRRWLSRALSVTLAGVLAACSSNTGATLSGPTISLVETTTSTSTTTTTTTTAPPPTTTQPQLVLPALPGSVAVRTPSGILALWHGIDDRGRMTVSTPCDRRATVPASTVVRGIDVLLDPGHGGLDGGAVSAHGLVEADVNLDVSLRAAAILRAAGFSVELTRDDDYFRTIADRGSMAVAIAPRAFISVHHNSGMDAPSRTGIGSEIYYQRDSPESRRLSGLLYEELEQRLVGFDVQWTRGGHFGVRYRSNDEGLDFYGVLRRTAGVPSALLEAAYLSNDREARVIGTAKFKEAEALAIATGAIRFLTTKDEGSGYQKGFVASGPSSNTDLDTCRDPVLAPA